MTEPETTTTATPGPTRLDSKGLASDGAFRHRLPPTAPRFTPVQHYAGDAMSKMDAVPRTAAAVVALDSAPSCSPADADNGAGRLRNGNLPATLPAGGHHATPVDAPGSQRAAYLTSPQLQKPETRDARASNGAEAAFSPPASGGRTSPGTSPDSQLLQLSQIAAAQERVPEPPADACNGSRKRTADGTVKHSRDASNVSPQRTAGHSRTTSAVSVASTSGTRIGEVSAELKARLSYAMVKVSHGWQSHTIDQVETLASQVASPTSSASTIHLRNGSSTSPQLSAVSHRASNNTSPATNPHHQASGPAGDAQWKGSPGSISRGSSASPVKTSHGLAPPVSIHPAPQTTGNHRRAPDPGRVPPFLSHQSSPRLGSHASPYLAPARHHSAIPETMLVSPHTNVREQDAIESLLFMSSPGNSANLKHAFPPSSQPLPSAHAPAQRTPLPGHPPRKTLPTSRPAHHARSQSQSQPQPPPPPKRVGFEKSPSVMDVDEASPRRRVNGGHLSSADAHAPQAPPPPQQPTPKLKQLPMSSGLTVPSKPRRALADEELDRMLDRAAAASDGDSDSDGEILLPARAGRRDGAVVE
ncbi:hypothetical protein VTJ83DRAFT_5194 [Remersonia thermophila]|uniref:Uncharacterized protein n=1 Tax=Remersonia thermophila TaxID=72144 RepID=A0ABR4DEB5_9PEZI